MQTDRQTNRHKHRHTERGEKKKREISVAGQREMDKELKK